MKIFVRCLSGQNWSWRCGELSGRARLPFISAARALLRAGTDPATRLELYHEGSGILCMTSTVGRLAYTSVDQDAMTFKRVTDEDALQLGLLPRVAPAPRSAGPANRG